MQVATKLKAGKYRIPVTMTYKGGRIYLAFGFSRPMIAEVKSMEGHKWHGFDEPTPRKIWSIADTPRNAFRLLYLQGENPYERYDAPLVDFESDRPLYGHQRLMVAHILTRHYCVLAGEMGLGKSLAWLESLDHIPELHNLHIWYVGPKSGVVSVKREFVKWNSKFDPDFMTYEKFRARIENWTPGDHAPRVVCFDESSKLKNPTAKRSQAARHLSRAIRDEWGDHGYIVLMSGTPAPKAPTDWWHQAEVACPGYLKEGTLGKFKKRLCLTEQRKSITGGSYPHLITWLDDERKCGKCGKLKSDPCHDAYQITQYDHPHETTINEVAALNTRIADLALIQFKRDCLDLPEKSYQTITVKPTVDTLRAARLIRATSIRAITAITLMRELSDGFQYTEEVIGKRVCTQCGGKGTYMGRAPREDIDPMAPQDIRPEDFVDAELHCQLCDENGQMDLVRRIATEVDTPKDKVFIELLDDHEDGGRFVVWGGFTGTIDRLVNIAHQQGWATLRVDGRGYHGTSPTGDQLPTEDMLDAMDASNPRRQELLDKYPKLCMVGHPKAGGMGLTFNISPVAFYYSNDFDGEARMQSEDRIHRMGMDMNRGAVIIDCIHLPTDRLVIDNLKKKKKLQSLTLGDIDDAFVTS